MNNEKLEIEDLLLDKGFRNWASGIEDDEFQFWNLLKEEYPQFKKAMMQARYIVITAEEELPAIDEETNNKMLANLRQKLGWSHETVVRTLNSSKKQLYLKIAAVVALIIMFGVVAFEMGERNNAKMQAVSEVFVQKSTPKGAKLNFYLEDGTHIILNAESQIRFSSTYATDSNRNVYLEGEAYFEVAKDKKRPFTVFTDNLSTVALGTAFNINAHPEEDKVQIALVEGSVLVKNSKNESNVILAPGNKLLADKLNNDFIQEKFDVKEVTSWKDGIIFLDKTDFDESIQILERWYGVNITVSNKPKTLLTCSGEFENDNLDNVLKSLGFALKFDFEIKNKDVKLKFK
ncbi:FecR family protein [Reichenbachiella sp. MALMAid0571]|uniref:FecR family protein n=1 Tax=Reichenbachiella sp. MALMAid0571 TaxID=3143939 RepID=UPI0032E00067